MKILAFGFLLFFLISEGQAGKDQGWNATRDLSFVSAEDGSAKSLNEVHKKLARREKELVDQLQHLSEKSQKRNVALFEIHMVLDDDSLVLINPYSTNQEVFDSSQGSELYPENYRKLFERNIVSNVKESCKEFISSTEGVSWYYRDDQEEHVLSSLGHLLTTTTKAAASLDLRAQRIEEYNQIASNYFFNPSPVEVGKIFDWMSFLFDRQGGGSSAAGSADDPPSKEVIDPVDAKIWKSFLKKRDKFIKENKDIEKERLEYAGKKRFSEDARALDPCKFAEMFSKAFEDNDKFLVDNIQNREEEAGKVKDSFFGMYWHSEQKIMNSIYERLPELLECVSNELAAGRRVVGLVLNLHSRLSICNICGRSIVSASNIIQAHLRKKLKVPGFIFKCFSSFRERREDNDYSEVTTLQTLETAGRDPLFLSKEVVLEDEDSSEWSDFSDSEER